MRKFYFLFMAFLYYLSGYSANCVSATKVSANYATQQVTFKLTWTSCNGTNHLNRVWCFVDFQPVDAIGNLGAWQRATISGTPVVVNGDYEVGNAAGFWVTGDNGQSATVTVKLGNAANRFNWCAHATDYPPNVTSVSGGTYFFRGTPPFILTAVDGKTQVVNGKSLVMSAMTVSTKTITDATSCTNTFCPYTGSDLYISGTNLCRQRTSGAKNWEAWIKDTRDNKLYRIVLMPDNKWWLAQNVKYAGTGSICGSGYTEDQCGWKYTYAQAYGSWGGSSGSAGNVQGVCPPGWVLPIASDATALVNSIPSATRAQDLSPKKNTCLTPQDSYGFASEVGLWDGKANFAIGGVYYDAWFVNGTCGNRPHAGIGYGSNATGACCDCTVACLNFNVAGSAYNVVVRCLRQ